MSDRSWIKRLVPESLITATRPLRLYFDPQHRFDRKFGVETTGFIEPEDLGASEASPDETGGYEATPREAFLRIIQSLRLEYSRYTFVDMGSGKGAVLLYAAEFPFRRIVGVEFSPELHRIAELNLASYRGRAACRSIRSICMNAAVFPVPSEPAVLFFFNPFKGRTLETVRENIERSVANGQRDLFVVYYHTKSRHPVFDRAARLRTIQREADHTVYAPFGDPANGQKREKME
ncbi:MAG TPA: class I SAM-dependent methyltransferase [Candidatus Binatia bacterium]|nr:class I SAM-dependent methyltransferase [Candidatus Binatia bacterium]